MGVPEPARTAPTGADVWRHVILVVVIAGSVVWILSLKPIAQNAAYHAFADTRKFLGIPNFLDVATNLPFLIVGLAGVSYCRRIQGVARNAWIVLFAGVAFVSVGSAYYHWNPNNDSLVWIVSMTIGFMGLFVALLGEYLCNRIATLLLYPAVLLGLASVVYWHFTGDLRPYFCVQLAPLLTIPVVMALFRSTNSHQWLLLVALALYVLAKVTESYDVALHRHTEGLISGHSMKHLLAGAACYSILIMLKRRKAIPPGPVLSR